MTGISNLPEWQDKYLREIERLVHDESFKADLKSLPDKDNGDAYVFALLKLGEKYNVQPTVIREYIKTGAISGESVMPRLAIISDSEETSEPSSNMEEAQFNYVVVRGFRDGGVDLHIPPNTSKIEVITFLKDHWKLVESKIGKPGRIRRHPTAERNETILILHKQGLSNHEITDKINQDYGTTMIVDDIGRIIRENQKNK